MFGWYVRAAAPWSEDADAEAIRSDWQAVGDDLWRATAESQGEMAHSPKQDRLFEPADQYC